MVHIIYFTVKSLLGVHFSVTDVLQGLIGGLNIVEFSWYPITALVIAMIFSISVFSKLGNSKIIKLLNKISYEMYLCHGLLIIYEIYFKWIFSNGFCFVINSVFCICSEYN